MGANSDRRPLSRDTIVAAGVALADEEGVGQLSMRKLARRLGFEVMSLYNHVANKRELLTLMCDAVNAEVERPPEHPTDPLAEVRSVASSQRAALARHPWAPGLLLGHMPGPERTRTMEDLLRLLTQSDLPPGLAHDGFHAVQNHVLGYSMQEVGIAAAVENAELDIANYTSQLSKEKYPHTVAHVDLHTTGEVGSSFELVLDLILDGLMRLARSETTTETGRSPFPSR